MLTLSLSTPLGRLAHTAILTGSNPIMRLTFVVVDQRRSLSPS